ncbi:MAG: histidinol-phosphate transaminase [Cellulosilyticum sp.]|nr:histidinol-phosphate transaminase [Cellulosilyticum sp.]
MRFLRERFSSLKPYHSAYLTEGVILNSNESPYDVPEALKDYMKEHVGELLVNRYPDTDSSELIGAISKAYEVKPENVVCGVGSDELIDCILASILDEDNQVLIPYPSFSMYGQFTLLNNGIGIKVPLKSDFTYDVEAMKEVIERQQPKVVFICNPNNPTGCTMARKDIEEILKLSKGLVIVDEAYEDFASESISVIPLIHQYDNLMVLRTFSKAYALAGARVGYGIACADLVDLINAVKPPYNLNLFSQLVATWAMEHREVFKDNAKKIISQRAYVDEGLKALGFKTYPSEANFIWVELPDDYFDALRERKIYIRKMLVGERNYYRITIGTPEENEILLSALKELKK